MYVYYAGGNVQTVSSLGDKEARKEWERIFNEHYIHPVLSTLDENLHIAMDHVANDEQQGSYIYQVNILFMIYLLQLCRS